MRTDVDDLIIIFDENGHPKSNFVHPDMNRDLFQPQFNFNDNCHVILAYFGQINPNYRSLTKRSLMGNWRPKNWIGHDQFVQQNLLDHQNRTTSG